MPQPTMGFTQESNKTGYYDAMKYNGAGAIEQTQEASFAVFIGNYACSLMRQSTHSFPMQIKSSGFDFGSVMRPGSSRSPKKGGSHPHNPVEYWLLERASPKAPENQHSPALRRENRGAEYGPGVESIPLERTSRVYTRGDSACPQATTAIIPVPPF